MKKIYFLLISLLFALQIVAPSRLYAQCPTPTQLSVSANTQNSVTLTWASSNVSGFYNVQYQTPNNPNWVILNNVSSPLTLTGLNCGGVYVCQVQQVCPQIGTTNPLFSDWSNITFTTLPCVNPCVAPTALTATNLNQNGAVLNWTGTSSATALYNIRYHSGNTTTWTTLSNVTMPYQLGNLPCGTGFEWQVQQICNTTPGTLSGVSPWSVGATFSTSACPNPCTTPTGSATTNITQTSAVLSWNPNIIATPTIYNIRYHTANSTTWIVANNVSFPYQLGNLTCGTGYVWQVQQVCSTANAPSAWSTGTTFSTPSCTTVCEAPTGLTSTNINQTSAVLNWNPNSTTTSLYNLQYHSASSNTWITVSNVTMPYQLGNLTCGTGYAWRVQRVCSNAAGTTPTLSDWTTSTFSTSSCTVVCEAPTGLTTTNINQTSVVLNWNPNSTTNSLYNLQYHSASSNTWITLTNVTMPYTLANLTCGTVYAWRVQRVCSNAAGTTPTLSDWTTSTFSTSSCTVVCEAPTGLTTTNINQTSVVLNWNPNSTTSSLYNLQYHSSTSNTWITITNVTNSFTLGNLSCGSGYVWQVQRVCITNPAGTTPILSPWSIPLTFSTSPCTNPCVAPVGLTSTSITQTGAVLGWVSNTTSNNLYNIRYHIGNSTTWTVVNNVSSPYQLGNLPCGTGFEWQVQQVCGPSSGTFSGVSPWSVGATFSTLGCPNPCVAPTQLSVSATTQNSVVITWAIPNTLTQYNVQYRADGNPNWILLNNVSSPLTLTGLNCGVVYIFQVQQVCSNSAGAATVSPWSYLTFATSPCPNPCVVPTGLIATNISQNGAVLNCTEVSSATTLYNIRYHSANSATWITLNNVSMPYQLGNLPCGTGFVWQVQQICGPSTGTLSALSPWSVSATFSTLACTNPNPCVAPTGLSTTNINQNSAVLHWGPVTTPVANLFNIRYRSANSTVWIVVNNVSSPYQLGNLSCSSGYVWQVQRICGTVSGTNTELSPWSTLHTFSTSPCMIPCAAPTELTANDITQTSAILNWAVVPGAVAYIVSYKPLNNTSAFITVTTNTNTITLNGLIANTSYTYQVKAICANGTVATNLSPLSAPYIFATPAALVIYPNPANEILRVAYLLNQGTPVTIQLRDSFGQLVLSANEIAVEGPNEFKLNTVGISEGIYLLTVITNSDTITSKVFIKH